VDDQSFGQSRFAQVSGHNWKRLSKHQLNGVATLLPCFRAFCASFGLFGESEGKRGVDLISDALPFG
jgi:hypothetical protein